MTKVVMVVKGMSVDKVVFVPHSVLNWVNSTSVGSSGVVQMPAALKKEVSKFYNKDITGEIPYRSMSFEEDVMAYMHKQVEPIIGVKKAEEHANENGWQIVDDFFVGNEKDFLLSEMSE